MSDNIEYLFEEFKIEIKKLYPDLELSLEKYDDGDYSILHNRFDVRNSFVKNVVLLFRKYFFGNDIWNVGFSYDIIERDI